MNDLAVRATSALVFAAVMLTAVCWNALSFFAVFTVIHAVCLFEFALLMGKIRLLPEAASRQEALGISLAGTLVYLLFVGSVYYSEEQRGLFLLPLLPALLFLADLFRQRKPGTGPSGTALSGLLYITLPLVLLSLLQCRPGYHHAVSTTHAALLLLVLIWTNDTMAYFSGRLLGRHKLMESVSPKKTWEGFFGGLLFTGVAAILLRQASWCPGSVPDALFIGVLVSTTGTAGDLFESQLKRRAGVKDSGRIMPGHGGLLDRFDAFLFLIPFIFVFELFRNLA